MPLASKARSADESEGMDFAYNVFIEKKPVLQQVVEAIGRR
jgi:hypothetical protein